MSKKLCLVVDDSRMVRKFARKILEDLDFEIEEAEDGSLALEACVRRMPDAILLDRNMPVMGGMEFLRELRKTEGGNDPVVVVCTTENDTVKIVEALEAGASEYIMKPFNDEIIVSKFTQAGLL